MERHIEKRKFPRVVAHIPIKYRKLGDSENAVRADTITGNLSTGGVRFKAPEFVSMAARLIIEMDMPMFAKPIKAISKIAWIRKAATSGEFEIGNQFLEISKKDKEMLAEYVNSLLFYNNTISQTSQPEENSDQTQEKLF